MDKFLKIKLDELKINLDVNENSEIIKNPIPILWNYKGAYGWIPVEIVKNAVEIFNFYKFADWPLALFNRLNFTWQQAYPLRQDVGKILEEMGNEQ